MDTERLEQFRRLVSDKLQNGDINAKKAYLRSIIDAVEVTDRKVRIIGRQSTLNDLISGSVANKNVRGFDQKWRSQGETSRQAEKTFRVR